MWIHYIIKCTLHTLYKNKNYLIPPKCYKTSLLNKRGQTIIIEWQVIYNNFQTFWVLYSTMCFLYSMLNQYLLHIIFDGQTPASLSMLATVCPFVNESCWVLARANRFITTNWRECAFCNMKMHWWFQWLEEL